MVLFVYLKKCLHQDKNRVKAIVIPHPCATMWFKMTPDWWQLITVTMTILIHLFCFAKTKTTRGSMRCQDCRCRWNVVYINFKSTIGKLKLFLLSNHMQGSQIHWRIKQHMNHDVTPYGMSLHYNRCYCTTKKKIQPSNFNFQM